jgi:hypothetical protein
MIVLTIIQYSEYGCNEVQPRVFDEVKALYSDKMTSLSGGMVYEYSQEEADYGLVQINSNGSVSLRTDFDNLLKQYNNIDLKLVQTTDSTGTGIKAPACKSDLIQAKEFSKNFTIPAVCPGCKAVIDNGISKKNNGKLVDVTNLKPKQAVYSSSGAEIKGLELTKRSDANTPSNQDLSSSSTGGGSSNLTTSAKPTASKEASATALSIGSWWGVTILGAVLIAALN